MGEGGKTGVIILEQDEWMSIHDKKINIPSPPPTIAVLY